MRQFDHFALGVIAGSLTPIIGYEVADTLFSVFTDLGFMDEVSMSGVLKRERTLELLAICFNIIPINIFRYFKMDRSMQGLIFPFLLFTGFWIYRHSNSIF